TVAGPADTARRAVADRRAVGAVGGALARNRRGQTRPGRARAKTAFLYGCSGGGLANFVNYLGGGEKDYLKRGAGETGSCSDTKMGVVRFESKVTMHENGERILVVDDDRTSRRMLTRALNEAGYACQEGETGLEALEMVHREMPSLVLLDFHMPELNGAEVLSRLRSDADPAIAQLPTIMLTGDAGEASEVHCL